MVISSLKLTNFRNYQRLTVDLSPTMNIFIGNNAVGKTNILESISVVALTKSYRNGNDLDMIRFSKNKAKIKAKVLENSHKKELAVEITNEKKTVSINGKTIHRIADYISNLNVVVFTPDDLEIMKGSPAVRRNLLNLELSQISFKYLVTYNEYNKILKTRNEYLKILFTNSIADVSYLDILTEKLVEKAAYIYQMRSDYLAKINETIDDIFNKITDDCQLKVEYMPNITIPSYDGSSLRQQLLAVYKKNYRRELHAGMTLYGPHRDDFVFLFQQKDMKIFASQGQQKSAVLAYKLATIPIFKQANKTNPVLLLDDIFSELDIKKKNCLLKFISKDIQSIITTTDLKNISKKALEQATVFQVHDGMAERS